MKLVSLFLLVALPGFAQVTNPIPNVRAWGVADHGATNVPPDLTNAVAIASSGFGTLALRSDGTVTAWGQGPVTPPPDLTNAVAIAANGGGRALAITANGTVVAWGNGADQLPPGLTKIVAIASGGSHSLAVKGDGTVVAWGDNTYGQCNVPPDVTNAIAVAGGDGYSLALRADGRVAAWGDNTWGECNVPADLTNAVAIAAGGPPTVSPFGLALRADGRITSWAYGPTPPNQNNIVAISAIAGIDSCTALDANGNLLFWGQCGVWCVVPPDLARVVGIAVGYEANTVLEDLSVAGSPPTILMQPQSQTVAVDSTALLGVSAVGFPPLTYQWYFDQTNAIPAATNAVLLLANLRPDQTGNYTATVSNSAGTTTSQPASLSVLPALKINMVPAISLLGGVGLTYRLDYIDAVGSTTNWITLATITLTNSPEYYFDTSAIGQPARFYRLVQVP